MTDEPTGRCAAMVRDYLTDSGGDADLYLVRAARDLDADYTARDAAHAEEVALATWAAKEAVGRWEVTTAERDALRAEVAALRARLNFLLRGATIAPTEEGENLALYLAPMGRQEETDRAFAFLAALDDTDEFLFTVEDAPFLSVAQLASLNGTVGNALGYVDDPATIEAALDAALTAQQEVPDDR